MNLIPEIDWTIAALHIRDMLIAFILAVPIGWDREKHERSAGLRTFPLVAVAACGYMLVGQEILDSAEAVSRVMEGIITGIGFIGGGAILKNVVKGESYVRGTATAASLWLTGAMGLSVAAGRLEIALVLSVLTFVTLRMLTSAKTMVNLSEDK
ncbi:MULTISPECIES: MgtC/SapB family protein [unclassified Arsukibacterium]|mgnify:FL=1|uniref:MgtC/SapB family protein n=1 Tax=unclassified Arsukibacterium TaxID=2635278 RepID=UPI000C8E9534|nr:MULTISPECIES: MgtC/SapB family protein [unclassified Arsukibacterium]MAA95901.1 magnesium transporter MgtC [Rheinheimera sp.]|tara:strand:- start:134338 stop:134799 length:462 start_codon:yes stop_codon:yes gene_type:complete